MGVNGIYGLSGSGIDVESMVKVGMMTKQTEYDKMYKKEIKDEWTKSAYADVYSSLNTFTNTTMSNYKMQSVMNAMSASSSDSTVVTATANGAAASMTHSVTVKSTSSNAYLLTGTGKTVTRSGNGASSTSTSLSDIAFYSITDAGTTDSSGNKQYTVKYSEKGDSVTVSASDTALSLKLTDSTDSTADSYTLSYTYEDLMNGKTLNDLATDIGSKDTNLQANYDATNDAFSIYNKNGGKTNIIGITVQNGTESGSSATTSIATKTLFDNLNLSVYSDGTLSSTTESYTVGTANTDATGTYADVLIDGKEYSKLSSNKLTVSGVTYTFVGKSTSTTSGTTTTYGSSTVSVSQNTDSIISTVKQFVTDYNKMIDSLNDKIYETKYSDYEPLTKSQEASMTSSQIEQWNTKAKSGLLYHSQLLRTITSNMREALYTPVDSVESKYNSASAIGITSSTDQGHITLDEDKLKAALAADPDSVYQIFASSQDTKSTSTDSASKALTASNNYANTGIANRLYDTLNDSLSEMKTYAGTSSTTDDSSTLGTLIANLKTKMSDFKTQMDAYEDVLYNKYDAMETAIQQLSSQLSTVTSSFS